MEDMINRIIEMDKQAKQLKQSAQAEKILAEKNIAKEKEQLYSKFIEQARTRSKKNFEIEQKHADIKLAEIMKKHQDSLSALNTHFETHKDKWIETIFELVVI